MQADAGSFPPKLPASAAQKAVLLVQNDNIISRLK